MIPQETEPKGWNGMKRRIEKLTKAVNALRTITIQRSGTSDSVSMGQDGITLNLREIKATKSGVSQGADLIHAFQLVSGGDALYVRKGTVNGVIPTIGGTPLDDDYLENELTIPGTGSSTYYLKAVSTGELDDEGVTSVTIETTDPGADTASQAKQTLGSVTTDSGNVESFSSNLTGSQNVDSCGSSHSWNRV